MQTRPTRFSVKDAENRTRTLHAGAESLTRLDQEKHPDGHIFFGLGVFLAQAMAQGQSVEHVLPQAAIASLSATNAQYKNAVLWLESSEVMAVLQTQYPNWRDALPAHWQHVETVQKLPSLSAKRALWWHAQNMPCFPHFWASVLGFVQAWLLRGHTTLAPNAAVIIPGDHTQLLHRELCLAFEHKGYAVHSVCTSEHIVEQAVERTMSSAHSLPSLHALLRQEQPHAFFSVNMQGLDTEGKNFALLRALHIPVGIWFVDNPWHVLSAVRTSWWKQATLFVTDASFIQDLRRMGATSVHHLPLAAAQHMWCHCDSNTTVDPRTTERRARLKQLVAQAPCIFVGRAAFPHKAQFFAASRVPPALFTQALHMLHTEHRPHFHWWTQKLMQVQEGASQDLWPGHAVRALGLGAEQCAMQQRALWLKQIMLQQGLVFGDRENWRHLLPDVDEKLFQASVDYYTELPLVYGVARAVLNVTSLLLPAGLTQRHFDVWAAGGFLLTNINEGLDIFPSDLTKSIGISRPTDILSVLNKHTETQRKELCRAWQEHICDKHCYQHRIETVLEILL